MFLRLLYGILVTEATKKFYFKGDLFMPIEKIIVALKDLDFDALSDEEVFQLSDALKSSSSRASRVAYFRTRQRSNHDPDIMATD